MFSIKWGEERLEGHKSGRHGEIHYVGEYVCSLNTWAFASCACFSIHGFSGWPSLPSEKVQALFDFLNSQECADTWSPNEIYFLLSETQIVSSLGKAMIGLPKVKLRDSFTNKSHSGRVMYLYRYSTAEDFT